MCGQTDATHDPYGCHSELPEGRRLEQTHGRFPFQMPACPFRVMRGAAEELGEVFRLVRDHDAGVIVDFPDSLTAGASDAVYYVLEHRDEARVAAMRLD